MLHVSIMHPHQLNQDLLESDGIEYPHGSYAYDQGVPYWGDQSHLSCIDPLLASIQHEYSYSNAHPAHYIDTQHCYSTYDPIAHGFSDSIRHDGRAVPCQFEAVDPWDHDATRFRQFRYLSPTDPSGYSLPSTTSSVSDYAFSPDATRNAQDFAFVQASPTSPASVLSMTTVPHQAWAPQTAVLQAQPVDTILVKHAALSMRDFQMTPDPELDEEYVDDVADALHAKINLPEELELSEQLASPPDSTLDLAIDDDDTLQDAEEIPGALQSDSDSDFRPAGRPSRRNTTVLRHSLRTPQQHEPKGIIDPKSRVHKSSSTSRNHAGLVSSSRSKSKRVATHKKKEPGSKVFPCAFHHYGCMATFASKNEWKRHVASQHLQLGFFRCDMGSCSQDDVRSQQRGFNDFNRKDLFTQHCRRMHAPWVEQRKNENDVSKKERDAFEKQLDIIRKRCWVDHRQAPVQSTCGICKAGFVDGGKSGSVSAWDQRMEHVGRHFERQGYKAEDEDEDEGLRRWALENGVVKAGRKKGEWVLAGLVGERSTSARDRTPAGRRRSGRVANALKKEQQTLEDDDVECKHESEDEGEKTVEVGHAGVPVAPKVECESDDDETEGGEEEDVDVDVDAEADADADAEAEDD